MDEPHREDTYDVVEGHEAFANRATAMVAEARLTVDIFSFDLDRRIYGSDAFLKVVRKFTLQHRHSRMRVLVNAAARAMGQGNRLIEFGRAMSTFIEFRDLPEEKAQIEDEYIIVDGRTMLLREYRHQVSARYYYGTSAHLARFKLKEFNALWDESPPAQELRNLRL